LCGVLSGGACLGGCLAGLCVPQWPCLLPRPPTSPPPWLLALAPCAGLLVGALPVTCGPIGELLRGCARPHPVCREVFYLRIAQVMLMVCFFLPFILQRKRCACAWGGSFTSGWYGDFFHQPLVHQQHQPSYVVWDVLYQPPLGSGSCGSGTNIIPLVTGTVSS
jgi:hypothetical protein